LQAHESSTREIGALHEAGSRTPAELLFRQPIADVPSDESSLRSSRAPEQHQTNGAEPDDEERLQPLIESIAQETAALSGTTSRTLAQLFLQQPSADVPIAQSSRSSSHAPEQHEMNSGTASETAHQITSQGNDPTPDPQSHHSGESASGSIGSFRELMSSADGLHEIDDDLFEIDIGLPSPPTDDDEQDVFDLDFQRADVQSTPAPAPRTSSSPASAQIDPSSDPRRDKAIESPLHGSHDGLHESKGNRKSIGSQRNLASGLQFGFAMGFRGAYSKRRPHKRDGSLPPPAPLGKLKKEEIESRATSHAIAASLQDTVAPPPTRQKRPGLIKRGAAAMGWSLGKLEDGHHGWNNGSQFKPAKDAGKLLGTEGTAAALTKKNQHLKDLGELVSSKLEELNIRLDAAEEVCGEALRACMGAEDTTSLQDAQIDLHEQQEELKGKDQSLRERLDQLKARHAELSTNLANASEVPAIPMGEAAVAAFHHQMAEASLMQAKLERDIAAFRVEKSNSALRKTRDEINALPSFSPERIKATSLIKKLEATHQDKLASLAQAERDILDRKTRSNEQEQNVTEVDTTIRAHHEALAQRAPIEQELAACHDMLTDTQHQLEAVQRALVTNEAEIERAWQAREARFKSDSAQAAVLKLRRQIANLGEQLHPVQDEAAVMQARAAEAEAAEAALQLEETRDREESMRTLIEAPPGFDHAPELSAELTRLRDRLDATLDKVPAAARLPVAETLEIVTRSLALETGGNAAQASRLLNNLMRLPLTALVPPPGHPIVDWSPANLVRRLVGMACGVLTLLRMTSNEGARPEPAQMNALQVYYRADTAIMDHLRLPESERDPATLVWLTTAARASKKVVHATESSRPLSKLERTAFNGVRNGFISLAKGSDYDITKQWLNQVSVWLDRAKKTRTMKHSPLSGRQVMQSVGFDVGLPTVERDLSNTLQAACEALLQRTTDLIIDARPEPSDELIQAATLLNRAVKRGQKHQRWDTLTIGRGDWPRIKRDSTSWAHREQVPGKVPRALRDATAALPQTKPDSVEPSTLRRGTSSAVNSDALGDALLGLATERKVQLLQVLQTLHPLLGAPARNESPPVEPVPAIDFTFLGGPLSPIEEEEDEEDEHEEQVVAEIRRRLNALRTTDPIVEPPPAPDEIGTLLSKAMQLQTQSANFTQRSELDSNALQAWLAPVVGATSGSVSASQGTIYGLSASGLSWAVNKLGPMLVGVSVTADTEITRRGHHELGVKRDSKGLNLLIGKTTQWTGKLGGLFSVGIPPLLKNASDKFTLGFKGGHNRSFSSTQAQGVALRAPKSDDMVQNFEDMLHTLLNWDKIEDEDGTAAFSDPLAALLATHPTVSVGTTSGKTKAFSAETALGFSLSLSGTTDINHKQGALGMGPEWRIAAENVTRTETITGAQGIDLHVRSRTLINSVRLALSAAFSPSVSQPHLEVRPRTLSMFLEKTLRMSTEQDGFKWVSMPDGTLVADRAMEFSSFTKFKQRIDSHREEWIAHVIRSTKWPEGLSPAAIRLCVEDDLNHFMERAKKRVRNGGTVTLNETMDVKPEVCARLTALASAGALAAEQGFEDVADKHLKKIQDLLGDDTSYMPYKAKVIVKSDIAKSMGSDWGIVVKSETRARGMNESETWPR